ncbi:MAG TPA: RT0821/Lpp0805 family surface protein [Casimicrobiaceae bacterium]|nr:RT0821/Lpp0805 family surface protein [Casimicrobiaceae bacterium]
MRTSRTCATLALVLLALAPMTGMSVTRSVIDSLPSTHMTPEDREMAKTAVENALDSGENGTTYRWQNPATGASGSVTPKKSFARDGMQCRKVDYAASAKGRNNASTWNVCKTPDGWKIID